MIQSFMIKNECAWEQIQFRHFIRNIVQLS